MIAWARKIAPMIAVSTVEVRRVAGSASMRAAWAWRRATRRSAIRYSGLRAITDTTQARPRER